MSSCHVRRTQIVIAIGAILLLAAPVMAQAQPDQRGFLMGLGGAAVTEVTAGTFAGAVGVNLTRNVQLTGEIGRLQDVFASFTKEDLGILEQSYLTEEGLSLSVKNKMPAVYAIGGVRLLVPAAPRALPYVTLTAGVAHLTPKPKFLVEGLDMTSVFMLDPEAQTALKKENRPVVGVGGGVSVTMGNHVTVDLGYKYSRIFIKKDYLQATPDVSPHQHTGINIHRVQFGLGYAF